MIIFVGNIGIGKSLIASKLAKQGKAIINMDVIQSMLAGGEYGKYDPSKKDLYHAIETSAIETALQKGLDIVIDRTNIDKKTRKRFIEIGQKYQAEIVCYHFGVGEKLKCIANRMKNNRGISQETWSTVYDKIAEAYERPTEEEGFLDIVEMPQSYRSYAFDFDGCIVDNKLPKIGKPYFSTINKMRVLSEDLQNIIIVWTCRSGEYEYKMREFLNKENIPFDAINYNPVFETGSRKLFAHTYYDDRNGVI